MFGNMAGGPAAASPIMGNTGAGGSMVPTPPPPMAQPQGSVLSIIMKALQDPATMAHKMAEAGITPQQFQQAMQQHNLASTMEAGTGQPANAESAFGPREESANYKPTSSQQYDIFGPQDAYGQSKNDVFGDPNSYHEPATPDKFIGQDVPSNIMDALTRLFSGGGEGNAGATSSYLGNNPQMVKGGEGAPPIVPPISNPVANINGSNAQATTNMPGTGPAAAMPIVPQAATGITQPSPTAQPNLPVIGKDYHPSSVMGGAGGTAPNLTGNAIYDGFMGAVRQQVTNPNALAAIAATGKSESGFSAGNAYGSWDDGGAPSGGIMSWRADRLNAMRAFVKEHGGDPNKPSPELQGEFFLQENPQLIQALNNAKTPEEAQKLMNNAWQFKGYDDSAHGEAARRIALATNMANQFAKGENPLVGSAGNDSLPSGSGSSTGVAAGNTATPQSLQSRLADVAAALQQGDGSGDWMSAKNMNLPQAPSPVPPRPGQYDPSAQMKQLMLAMLYGGGGAQIPSLGQLIGGR